MKTSHILWAPTLAARNFETLGRFVMLHLGVLVELIPPLLHENWVPICSTWFIPIWIDAVMFSWGSRVWMVHSSDSPVDFWWWKCRLLSPMYSWPKFVWIFLWTQLATIYQALHGRQADLFYIPAFFSVLFWIGDLEAGVGTIGENRAVAIGLRWGEKGEVCLPTSFVCAFPCSCWFNVVWMGWNCRKFPRVWPCARCFFRGNGIDLMGCRPLKV